MTSSQVGERPRFGPGAVRAWMIPMLLVAVVSATVGPAAAAKTWALATRPRAFVFPADHAAHPAYRAEWWYYTGVLHDSAKRTYGFELTFFRVGLVPELTGRRSKWAARDILFAHFAVSDIPHHKFFCDQKIGRPVLGLAGYSTKTLNVYIGNWRADLQDGRMMLSARSGRYSLRLTLTPREAPVPNGDAGLSVKGPGAENANYYYSIPRLATVGQLTVDGRKIRVNGMSWMDHEWGTSSLASTQRGWDWFSLRLSDGRDLMVYSLRGQDGKPTGYSRGTLVEQNGEIAALKPGDFRIDVKGWWKSPKTGARYPSGWSVSLPKQGLLLTVDPMMPNQELVTSGLVEVAYWEGAVSAHGTSHGEAVHGDGYVELTGYAHTGGTSAGLR